MHQVGRWKRNAEVSSQLMKLYSLSPSWAASHAAGHSVCTAEQSSGHIEDESISVPHGPRYIVIADDLINFIMADNTIIAQKKSCQDMLLQKSRFFNF